LRLRRFDTARAYDNEKRWAGLRIGIEGEKFFVTKVHFDNLGKSKFCINARQSDAPKRSPISCHSLAAAG
jgi:diketogulonate reductase-like aldo/keto reductase